MLSRTKFENAANRQGNVLTRRLVELSEAFHQNLLEDELLSELTDELIDCCARQLRRLESLRISPEWLPVQDELVDLLQHIMELADTFDTLEHFQVMRVVYDLEQQFLSLESTVADKPLELVA